MSPEPERDVPDTPAPAPPKRRRGLPLALIVVGSLITFLAIFALWANRQLDGHEHRAARERRNPRPDLDLPGRSAVCEHRCPGPSRGRLPAARTAARGAGRRRSEGPCRPRHQRAARTAPPAGAVGGGEP